MRSDWKNYKIGDLCKSISETYNRNDSEVILINTSDVLNGKILNHEPTENRNLRGQFKKTFKKDDILYSEIRPANKRYAYVDFDDTEKYIASTKLMVLRPNIDLVLPRFLFAWLTSNNIIAKLQHLAETRSGTFPQITFLSELAPLKISLPPLTEQQKISSILSLLDDKIELNNRINENLEQQARAIFENFFADDILHSDKCVPLGDLIIIIDNRGKTPPLTNENFDYPIIDVGALKGAGRIIDFNNCTKYVTQNIYNTWFRSGHPQSWDILISTVGSLAEMKIFLGTKGCIAQNVVAFRAKSISPLYLYQYLNFIRADLISYNIGSVQPSIKVTHIIKHPIFIPDKSLITKFEEITKVMTEKIFSNSIENQTLAQIRDSLLPKLISGELDISGLDL